MGSVTKLITEKTARQAQVDQVVAAINQLENELTAVVVFGKCGDGAFVTLAANTLEPELLGYSYSQLNTQALQLAQMMESTAENVPLP